MSFTAADRALINSRATVHLMENVWIITGNAAASDISFGMAGKDTIMVMAQSECTIKLSERRNSLL